MAALEGTVSGTEGGALSLLILSNGLTSTDLAACLEDLKSSSKSAGTHVRRELLWNAYGQFINKCAAIEGQYHGFMTYSETSGVELISFTQRQQGLVGGGCDIMGRKLKAPDTDAASKAWCMAWAGDEAELAMHDLMSAEPCIYITSDGCFVATRFKRALCKGCSLKTIKDVEAFIAELKPGSPLRSLSFSESAPPSTNPYNTFLAGSWSTAIKSALPPTLGHIDATSTADIYDYFLSRKKQSLLAEAASLIAQMLTDVSKGVLPIIATSVRDASAARKSSLMKRVFVHGSKSKFIANVRAEGAVELNVIEGDISGSRLEEYGGVVFELFYRVDLSTM